MEALRRLGDRLDVIETALAVALEEPEPEHRGRMLEALSAATEVARAEHREAETVEEKRSSFRLLHGAIPLPAHPADQTSTRDAAPGAHSTYRIPDRAVRSAG